MTTSVHRIGKMYFARINGELTPVDDSGNPIPQSTLDRMHQDSINAFNKFFP